jgi:DNA-binding beta-propeller fold protein YncE
VVNTALASSPDSIAATIPVGTGAQPVGLAMTPNGCLLYVADATTNKIFVINTATNVLSTAFTTACGALDPQPMQVTADDRYLLLTESSSCSDLQVLNTATNAVTTLTTVGADPLTLARPPVPYWYQITATHSQWTSNPSNSGLYPIGWNPGGWQ